MMQTLFTNWHLMRWLRLVIGLIFAVQALYFMDPVPGFAGAFFLFQAATNSGCCGANGCALPVNEKKGKEEINFKEIN